MRAERERARWRLHLVRHRSSLKQRVHAVLLTHGKPCPVSDLFGMRGRQLLAKLGLPEPWQGTIEASLRLIDELDREISDCERELRRLGADHRYVPLLCTVPGISWVLAYTIAAELGDIGRFPTSRKLAGYSGLCPRVYQSGDRDLHGPLSKQGPRRRSATSPRSPLTRLGRPWSGSKIFTRALRGPMCEFAAGLEAEYGRAKVYRLHSTPSLWVAQHAYLSRSANSVYGVTLDLDGLEVEAGWLHARPELLPRYREAVLDGASGGRLRRIVDDLERRGYEIIGETLRSSPRGVPGDHPRVRCSDTARLSPSAVSDEVPGSAAPPLPTASGRPGTS